MAPPPPKKALTLADIPGAPEWAGRLLGAFNAFSAPTAEALGQGLTFRENFAGELREVEVTPSDDWRPLTASDMRNGWQIYPSNASPLSQYELAIRKTPSGEVEVRGLAIPPTTTATGIAFAWPEGHAPVQEEIFGLRGELQTVEVRTAAGGANVTARTVSGVPAQGWVSFSGLRFAAADPSPRRWDRPADVRLGNAQTRFPGKPGNVIVLKARRKDGQTHPLAITALADWSAINLDSRGTSPGVRIHRIYGLQPGVTYFVTLLILPE